MLERMRDFKFKRMLLIAVGAALRQGNRFYQLRTINETNLTALTAERKGHCYERKNYE